jgi:hypothetical protein
MQKEKAAGRLKHRWDNIKTDLMEWSVMDSTGSGQGKSVSQSVT